MKKTQSTIWAAAAVVTLFSGVALATPPSGVTGTVWARAGFVDPTDLKFKVKQDGAEVVAHAPDAQETVMQSIVIQPGGHTGWHSHPGPVVVLVKSGELTLYDGDDPGCTGRTYTAGEAFIDRGQGHVHFAGNTGAVNTELWVTYFDVPPGQPFRVDAAAPGTCAF
jgi:quercetin dioxygenase-like cupin family protein